MLVNLQIPCKDPAPYFIDHFAFSKEITLTAVTKYLKYFLKAFFLIWKLLTRGIYPVS